MNWSDVGDWIKENAGIGASLVGSLLTGNIPGAIASGVSLVSSATGSNDPIIALEQLQTNPETLLKLKELYYQEEQSIREHIRSMKEIELVDLQKEHETTQKTIQIGDLAEDEFVRHTRPKMARESWIGTVAYCIGCFGVHALTKEDYFNVYIAGFISAPAFAYLGLRTTDKAIGGVKGAIKKIRGAK